MNRFVPPFFFSIALPALAAAQTVDQLTPHRVKLESVDYRGKRVLYRAHVPILNVESVFRP